MPRIRCYRLQLSLICNLTDKDLADRSEFIVTGAKPKFFIAEKGACSEAVCNLFDF